MVNEDAALLNRRVTHMTPAALFGRRLHIGIDITDASAKRLPPTAGCGPDERIVLVPRKTLVLAKSDIPNRG